MSQQKPLLDQSKIRVILNKAQFALKEDRYDEALQALSEIEIEDMRKLHYEELHAIGKLIIYLKELAEEKKLGIVEKLRMIQASKEYLE
ncbi:hypothetical protein TAGGR_2144 [Thermodesulfovibrio aggregans]|uniref:Uncharacterized protein n=1 Tax=Thermodesulfovibrio aggregans TaxID=86166 RepID=A0A0U9HQC2_9BACT|nr:hypothetical protein [Thermodesulfovibrio aggregans]GAQ95255.1 hypothetical protein TAGGR_2144 [Thermodesulfovibrio aggregans]